MNKVILSVSSMMLIFIIIIFSSMYYMNYKQEAFHKELDEIMDLHDKILSSKNLMLMQEDIELLRTKWNIFAGEFGSRAVAPFNKDDTYPFDIAKITSKIREADNFLQKGYIEEAKQSLNQSKQLWQDIFKRNSISFKTE